MIEKSTIDGQDFYTTVRRGVSYCAYFSKPVGEWFVSSRRLSLGRRNAGGGRYLKAIGDHTAFAELPALLSAKGSLQ